jgi:hypothetical protein
MSTQDKKNIKKWVDAWKRAGKALKDIKRQELRSYNYQENKAVIDGMLQWACDHPKVRLGSGLVEQQKIFLKIRNRGR